VIAEGLTAGGVTGRAEGAWGMGTGM
jgi:hypothetical protein